MNGWNRSVEVIKRGFDIMSCFDRVTGYSYHDVATKDMRSIEALGFSAALSFFIVDFSMELPALPSRKIIKYAPPFPASLRNSEGS